MLPCTSSLCSDSLIISCERIFYGGGDGGGGRLCVLVTPKSQVKSRKIRRVGE